MVLRFLVTEWVSVPNLRDLFLMMRWTFSIPPERRRFRRTA